MWKRFGSGSRHPAKCCRFPKPNLKPKNSLQMKSPITLTFSKNGKDNKKIMGKIMDFIKSHYNKKVIIILPGNDGGFARYPCCKMLHKDNVMCLLCEVFDDPNEIIIKRVDREILIRAFDTSKNSSHTTASQ